MQHAHPTTFALPFYRAIQKLLPALLLSTLLCTCDRAPTTETPDEGAGVDTKMEDDLSTLNDGNTDLYDVDPEDPYLISNGSLLGFKPGEPLAAYRDALRPGKIRDGEGTHEVFFIDGAEGGELGYLMASPTDPETIGDIYITSPAVVTEQGIRIGATYAELQERIGAINFHGSEIEGRIFGSQDGLAYRLDGHSTEYAMDNSGINPETPIVQIVIESKPPL